MNKHTIPTLLVIVFLMVGLIAGVLLTRQQQVFRLSASSEYVPNDIRITNITDTSFTVSWLTSSKAAAAVTWGDTPLLGQESFPADSTIQRIHYITVDKLEAQKTYYFKIKSGGALYDNGGVAWMIKTAPTLPNVPSGILSGTIETGPNVPAASVIVYARVGGATEVSAKTSKNGTWVLPLSLIRTQNLSAFSPLKDDTYVELFVQGGELGSSVAKVLLGGARTTPTVTLGQNFDFRDRYIDPNFSTKDAEVQLPLDDTNNRLEVVVE